MINRLEIVIAIISSKLNIRNVRAKTRLSKLIRYYKEAVMIEYRYREME